MENHEKQQNTAETNVTEENEHEAVSFSDPEEKSTGAIIGAIIIVVLIVIGGLYYIGSRNSGQEVAAPEETPEAILDEATTAAESIEAQGTSDEVSAIEQDVNNTNIDKVDIDLGNIEAELGL